MGKLTDLGFRVASGITGAPVEILQRSARYAKIKTVRALRPANRARTFGRGVDQLTSAEVSSLAREVKGKGVGKGIKSWSNKVEQGSAGELGLKYVGTRRAGHILPAISTAVSAVTPPGGGIAFNNKALQHGKNLGIARKAREVSKS